MQKIGLVILFFLSLSTLQLSAQKKDNSETTRHIEEMLELLSEDVDAEIDFGAYLELFTDLAENPINLNKVDYEGLSLLQGLLSQSQINNFLLYREKVGKLFNIYELQAVPSLDLETIRNILPFVEVRGDLDDFRVPFGKLLFGGKHSLFIRYTRILEDQKAFNPTLNADGTEKAPKFLGSPDKLFTRYRYKYGNKISYGFTAEKDAGEEFFRGSQKRGFDFYSAHLYFSDLGPIKRIVVGDYEVRMGQGLIAWTGLAFNKSIDVMGIMRQAPVLRPYTSVNEVNFMRGGGVTVDVSPKIEATVFASHKKTDVGGSALVDTLTEEIIAISSIQQSGMHRTLNEVARKGDLKVTNAGGNIKYDSRRFSIGANVIYTKYNKELILGADPYNTFRFQGNDLLNASLDYRWLYKNFHFFGETAISHNGGIATTNGLLMSLHPTIDVSASYRNFRRNFHSVWSNPFRESSSQNESGFFLGAVIKPVSKWRVNAYFDIYKHRWLRYQVDAPSFGMDRLIQLTYRPSRSLEMYARYKSEVKKVNKSGFDGNDFITNEHTAQMRFQVRYKVNKAIALKSRFQMSFFNDTPAKNTMQRGYMLFQDVNFKPLSFPLSFSTRLTLFDTDNYDTRIYAFENDVLYSFSIPAYSGRGMRYYLVLRYKVIKGIDLWLRYAQTYYDDRTIISPGGDAEILGRTKSEFKAQIRFRF